MGHIADRSRRRVSLRAERSGRDSRNLDAYVDTEGNLHIDGQDLGPGTSIVSSDGEYEWFQTIHAAHLPDLKVLLGGVPEEDILDILERSWTGARAGELEKLLRDSGIPVDRSVWSG